MDTNSDRHPATSAAVEHLNAEAAALMADEHDVEGLGGLSGGVVGSACGVPGLAVGAVGASRGGDVQIQGRKPGIGMGDSGSGN